jgi:hypothetical protein
MDDHHAPEAEITLGMGRRKGSLSVRNVIDTVQDLLAINGPEGNEVTKITAVGGDDEDSIAIDLIQDRIVESASVALGPNRRLSDFDCAQALVDAYAKRRDEIKKNYGA